AAGVQAALATRIEILGKQNFAGPVGVGGIGDDDIEALVGILDEVEAVADYDIGPWVVKSTCAVKRQILFGEIDNSLVDFNLSNMANPGMSAHFAQDATVATADDEHTSDLAVGDDGHVSQHLVVDEFVTLGGLYNAV